MKKLHFSGHEKFPCKLFWLKKGYDFVRAEGKFSDDTAVIDLGVGKNMVNSIRHWMKSFGITDDKDNLQEIAEYLFGEKGRDLFIEDIGTTWLLHYLLVFKQRSSIYNLLFNYFRKERFDFTRTQVQNFIKRECEESRSPYNDNTVKADINVLLKNYLKPNSEKFSVEDDFVGLLQDLELIKHYKLINTDNKLIDWYKIDNEERGTLPIQIVLFAILHNGYGKSVSFRELQIGINSPGMVFALNAEGLFKKITEITRNYPGIIFSETAGNQVLQFKSKPQKLDVLNDYYQKK